MPSADVAVSLTQAELQLADHQLEQALATLKHLRSVAPKHTYVLRLLRRLYEQLGDWEHLRELLPELRRRKVEDDADLAKTLGFALTSRAWEPARPPDRAGASAAQGAISAGAGSRFPRPTPTTNPADSHAEALMGWGYSNCVPPWNGKKVNKIKGGPIQWGKKRRRERR